MEKRGQFFLIAALVIIVLLISAFAIYNTAIAPPQDSSLESLSGEINFESSQIIDNGIFQNEDREDELNDLIDLYSKSNPDSEIAILYEDFSTPDLELLYYACEETGDINAAGSNVQSFCKTKRLDSDLCLRTGILDPATDERDSVAAGDLGTLDPSCLEGIPEEDREDLLVALNANQVQLIFPKNLQSKIFDSDSGESFFLVLRKSRGGEQIVQTNK